MNFSQDVKKEEQQKEFASKVEIKFKRAIKTYEGEWGKFYKATELFMPYL